MTRANKSLVILLVSTCGLWGCAKGPTEKNAALDRAKFLESKLEKVEEDFRVAAATRDQLRQKLAALEKEQAQLRKQVDDTGKLLSLRTNERDSLQVQYDQFRSGIRSLLGQAEAAAAASSAQHASRSEKSITTTTVSAGDTTGSVPPGCSTGSSSN